MKDIKEWIILVAVFFIVLALVGFKLEMNANIIHLNKDDYKCLRTGHSNASDHCDIYKYIGYKNHE